MVLEKGKIVGSRKMWFLSHHCHHVCLHLQDQSRKSGKISKHLGGIIEMFTQLNKYIAECTGFRSQWCFFLVPVASNYAALFNAIFLYLAVFSTWMHSLSGFLQKILVSNNTHRGLHIISVKRVHWELELSRGR